MTVTKKSPTSEVVNRLARIEARLVQLMLHMGLDPYKQTYVASRPKDKQ